MAHKPGSLAIASIWAAQVMIALPFGAIAQMKLMQPIGELATHVPWAAEYPRMVRVMGAIDLAGAIGIVVPALTGIRPGLTVWAAIGCAALMIAAIVFHLARCEAWATPINVVYLALALYVWWGRTRAAATPPRTA